MNPITTVLVCLTLPTAYALVFKRVARAEARDGRKYPLAWAALAFGALCAAAGVYFTFIH